jgi:hypothetical protein
MGRDIFDSDFKKARTFDIEKINFDQAERRGTCELTYKCYVYEMIWTIRAYPTELPSMPGAPYPLKVNYTIFKRNNNKCKDDSNESMSAEFIFELNSGTLPQYNALGLPNGFYFSLARNNYCNKALSVLFKLTEDYMEVCVYK